MEIFRYSKLASETGRQGLIGLAIVAAFLGFMLYKQMAKGGDFSQTKVIVFIVIGAALAYAATDVFKRLKSTGSWEIIVDDKTLQWHAPRDVEESFVINLDEIKQINKTVYANGNSVDIDIELTGKKADIRLNHASGVDFDELLAALAARGVKIDKTEELPNE